jgi:hypothetical protein
VEFGLSSMGVASLDAKLGAARPTVTTPPNTREVLMRRVALTTGLDEVLVDRKSVV